MADTKNPVAWTGGIEHWTKRSTPQGDIDLFLWSKLANPAVPKKGVIFFVHGSSMASQPTFDLNVPGRPWSSAMDWFANQGLTPGRWTARGMAAPASSATSTATAEQ